MATKGSSWLRAWLEATWGSRLFRKTVRLVAGRSLNFLRTWLVVTGGLRTWLVITGGSSLLKFWQVASGVSSEQGRVCLEVSIGFIVFGDVCHLDICSMVLI